MNSTKLYKRTVKNALKNYKKELEYEIKKISYGIRQAVKFGCISYEYTVVCTSPSMRTVEGVRQYFENKGYCVTIEHKDYRYTTIIIGWAYGDDKKK